MAKRPEAERSSPHDDAPDIDAILAEIAGPRLSGSRHHRQSARRVRARMEAAGYECTPIPFTFSVWAGRFGVSAAAAAFTAGCGAGALLLAAGRNAAAITACVAGLMICVALVATWTWLLHALPWGRQDGENLLFQRPGASPRFFIVAHLDTKSQLLPLSLRTHALVAAGIGWAVLVGGASADMAGLPVSVVALSGALLSVGAGGSLALSWAGDRSPGVLDNGSGVVAALGIAIREAGARDVAVLITDAEELGLAGARAAAPMIGEMLQRSAPGQVHGPAFGIASGVINLDGLDDHGAFYLLDRFGLPIRGGGPHLARALLREAERSGQSAHHRPVPPGLLLDHMPLSTAGLQTVSILRGSLRSLRRVHRPIDDLSRIDGSGIRATIDLVCGALEILRQKAGGPAPT